MILVKMLSPVIPSKWRYPIPAGPEKPRITFACGVSDHRSLVVPMTGTVNIIVTRPIVVVISMRNQRRSVVIQVSGVMVTATPMPTVVSPVVRHIRRVSTAVMRLIPVATIGADSVAAARYGTTVPRLGAGRVHRKQPCRSKHRSTSPFPHDLQHHSSP